MRRHAEESLIVMSIIVIFLLFINLLLVLELSFNPKSSLNIGLKNKIKYNTNQGLNNQLENQKSKNQASKNRARLELTIINPDCNICPGLQDIIYNLSNYNIDIVTTKTLSVKQASSLISKYGIKRLPALILTGEINKTTLQFFKRVNNALVYETNRPPFVDTETSSIKGIVSYTIIEDNACKQCINMSFLIQLLKRNNIVFSNQSNQILNYDSDRAKQLLADYNISRLPCLLVSRDLELYTSPTNLERAGFVLKKDYYVLESPPPYVDVKTKKLRGLVSLIMLNDSSCGECYDVNIHKQILSSFGLLITNETVIDINSDKGKELISKYNISKVPTIILKGDVSVYKNLNQVWPQVGTIENNTYIFRNLTVLKAPYKDLAKNIVVTPSQ